MRIKDIQNVFRFKLLLITVAIFSLSIDSFGEKLSEVKFKDGLLTQTDDPSIVFDTERLEKLSTQLDCGWLSVDKSFNSISLSLSAYKKGSNTGAFRSNFLKYINRDQTPPVNIEIDSKYIQINQGDDNSLMIYDLTPGVVAITNYRQGLLFLTGDNVYMQISEAINIFKKELERM